MKNKFKGFTLIELLVVISIIVILISMGITSFSTAQRKAGDAKRKADLREMKISLEQYYTVCGLVYPELNPGESYYTSVICQDPYFEIMLNAPLDPKTGSFYVCVDPPGDNCNSTGFNMCSDLEGEAIQYCIKNSQ